MNEDHTWSHLNGMNDPRQISGMFLSTGFCGVAGFRVSEALSSVSADQSPSL